MTAKRFEWKSDMQIQKLLSQIVAQNGDDNTYYIKYSFKMTDGSTMVVTYPRVSLGILPTISSQPILPTMGANVLAGADDTLYTMEFIQEEAGDGS